MGTLRAHDHLRRGGVLRADRRGGRRGRPRPRGACRTRHRRPGTTRLGARLPGRLVPGGGARRRYPAAPGRPRPVRPRADARGRTGRRRAVAHPGARPPSCASFLAEIRPRLEGTPEAREAARVVILPPLPVPRRFVLPARLGWTTVSTLAVGLLPSWARRMYRLPPLPGASLTAAAGLRALRGAVRTLPAQYREGPDLPPGQSAGGRARLSAGHGPSGRRAVGRSSSRS